MKICRLKLGIALLAIMLLHTCQPSTKLHPVIIVPGSGGNQLEARLTSSYKPTSLLCNRWFPLIKQKEGWFRLWFDPSVMLPPFTHCLADRLMLYYHQDLDDYCNAPGIETRVPHFGSTDSLLCLDPNLKAVTEYMAPLVQSLQEIGYIDGESLFGAPYDFRYGLAAKGHPCKVGSKFLQDLKQVIEKASSQNGGKPVIILSHSLGGLFALQLLNRNSISWRKKYIKHFIALSAPWGGSVQLMLTLASGNTLGVPFVDPLLVRGEQRSSETNIWLLPNPKIFGTNELVTTPNATYSSYDIPQFLNDIGFPEGVYPYESRILPLILEEGLIAPEVPITCIIGSGVETAESLIYGGNNGFDEQPTVVNGDGDGTVNMASLLALETMWSNGKENQDLKVIRLHGVSHTSILKQDIALDEIIREISCINSNVMSSVL
ncbi:lecithin-cholesterol acyltransferase-like 1 [Mercurialis annua]|uniref:lecithin-cholesterol acyltransferase-like 1 n=1 Tax=Mercurialis annua TaxID=3986 RepID=UPI002160F398|nr:lecithin-cholesterol acyltransferase-like 1 [Mercurialis annua]